MFFIVFKCRNVGGFMNEQQKLEYAGKELEAIYEELEKNIEQQLLIKGE